MADNTVLASGSGGDTLATDDIAGVKFPRSKIVIGADGVNDGDVSSVNPLPVSVGGTITVGTHAVTQSGVWNIGTVTTVSAVTAITNALPAGDNNIGNVDIVTVPADPFGVNADAASAAGSISAKLRFIASTGIPVTGTVTVGSHAVTNAGTFAVQSASAGDVAHDTADSGNPHKLGAKASTALSGLTLVADADRTNLFAGIDGVLIVRPHGNLEDIVSGVAAITDGSSTSVIASSGAGVKTYITSVTIANSSATDITVDLRDGTGGAVKWTFPVPQAGGVTHTFNPPLPFSAATAVAADPSAAASTVTVSLLGFKSKV